MTRSRTAVRSWPLLVLAVPAAAEVWSGWVGIARLTGFGMVSPLPGIWPSLHLDTSIALPVGVEAYAAYALRAWLAGEHAVSPRTRRFARWSALLSFALGMAGQVTYHLLAGAGMTRAPWAITTIVSCLPVLVLAMGTTLAHLLRDDALTARTPGDCRTGLPGTWPAARSPEDQARSGPDQADAGEPAPGPPLVPKEASVRDHLAAVRTSRPDSRLRSARMALPDHRLEELSRVAASTGNDPALDTLLLRLHMETACRRGGALALMPSDLDPEQCLIRLHEKGETVRWQPVSPTLMAHLIAHAESRGGLGTGQRLLRYASGRPISARRYDYLWERLGQHLPWVEAQQVSMHWIRHTILTWVERQFGFAVAQAYAGHEDRGRGARSMAAMATYVRAGLPEVATALAALTGEPHPLAITPSGAAGADSYQGAS